MNKTVLDILDPEYIKVLLARYLRHANDQTLSPNQRAYWQRLFDMNVDRYPALQDPALQGGA